jgi:hypothetical protein
MHVLRVRVAHHVVLALCHAADEEACRHRDISGGQEGALLRLKRRRVNDNAAHVLRQTAFVGLGTPLYELCLF